MAKIAIAVATTVASAIVNRLINRPKLTSQGLQHPEVSSAANGAPIPIPFGMVRVPGQIIWASGITAVQFEESAELNFLHHLGLDPPPTP